MTTQNLYEFLILSKTLNYSKAADTLYISQPALTKHIQAMEKELGVNLFYRTTHGVNLTTAGILLSKKAVGLIEKCNKAASMVRVWDPPVSGIIRIACALEFAYASHIRLFIEKFQERCPEIHIDIHILSEGTPESLLQKQEYDFILTPCEFLHLPDSIHRNLIQSHGIYAALYPGHPLLSKPVLQIRDLAGENIIVPFFPELFGPYAKNWALVKKYTHDQVSWMEVPNVLTGLYEVQLRKGIILVPKYVKNIVPDNHIFFSRISSAKCSFDEYIYYFESESNEAAKLFYQEFQNAFF